MLSRNNIIIIGIALLTVAVIGGGLWAYDFVQGDTLAPSGPITAIPLAANTVAPTLDAPGQVSQPEPTEFRPTSEASATVEPTIAATSTTQVSGPAIFQISQDQSEVRFSIYEELAGEPKTVVGATSQVAGEVAVDLADLSKAQAGVIQINARTFVTDSERRNRAIRNFILWNNGIPALCQHSAIPMRAPAILALMASIAIAATYYHPALGNRQDI